MRTRDLVRKDSQRLWLLCNAKVQRFASLMYCSFTDRFSQSLVTRLTIKTLSCLFLLNRINTCCFMSFYFFLLFIAIIHKMKQDFFFNQFNPFYLLTASISIIKHTVCYTCWCTNMNK